MRLHLTESFFSKHRIFYTKPEVSQSSFSPGMQGNLTPLQKATISPAQKRAIECSWFTIILMHGNQKQLKNRCMSIRTKKIIGNKYCWTSKIIHKFNDVSSIYETLFCFRQIVIIFKTSRIYIVFRRVSVRYCGTMPLHKLALSRLKKFCINFVTYKNCYVRT